jgi:L-rhamnose isomerase
MTQQSTLNPLPALQGQLVRMESKLIRVQLELIGARATIRAHRSWCKREHLPSDFDPAVLEFIQAADNYTLQEIA